MLDKLFSDFDFKKNVIDDAVTSWEIQNASVSDFEKICNILMSDGFPKLRAAKTVNAYTVLSATAETVLSQISPIVREHILCGLKKHKTRSKKSRCCLIALTNYE